LTCTTLGSTFRTIDDTSVGLVSDVDVAIGVEVAACVVLSLPTSAPIVPPSPPATRVAAATTASVPLRTRRGGLGGRGGGG
jgi:hypothetical protein